MPQVSRYKFHMLLHRLQITYHLDHKLHKLQITCITNYPRRKLHTYITNYNLSSKLQIIHNVTKYPQKYKFPSQLTNMIKLQISSTTDKYHKITNSIHKISTITNHKFHSQHYNLAVTN